jgi:alpha-galactosidase
MNMDLSSEHLAFHLRIPEGSWDLHALLTPRSGFEEATMSARWRKKRKAITWSGAIRDAQLLPVEEQSSPHGLCKQASVRWVLPKDRLEFVLNCAVLLDAPLFLWRVHITNASSEPVFLDEVGMLSAGRGRQPKDRRISRLILPMRLPKVSGKFGAIRLHTSPGDLAFYSNGWQSWNFSGVLGAADRFPRSRLGPFTLPLFHNPGTPRPRQQGHFISEMFGALGDRTNRRGFLAGFLSQREAFGSLEAELDRLEPRLRMWVNADGVCLDSGETFTTDWACLQPFNMDEEDPFGPYLEAVALENSARRDAEVPVGWCSWYHFFENVTADDVEANLDWAAKMRDRVPLDWLQLDDGFQENVGDWFRSKASFPDGAAGVARKVKEAGFRAGIWLAPWIVKPNARIIKEHPDWLLRRQFRFPVQAGFIWNTFTKALDITHPQVLEHVRGLIRTAVETWGFDYLKLDFLYAGALDGKRHDPGLTRAQAMHRALVEIREAAGEGVTLLGCGCPLGVGIGVFDAMRIGPDVAPNWHPTFPMMKFFFKPEPGFPSVRNALRNTITRSWLHRRWWVNDPDCLLMRSTGSDLSVDEVQSLASGIALSAGSLFVSDHLPELDEERVDWLARLLPPLPQAARALDWFEITHPSKLILPLSDRAGQRHLLALQNWSDRPMAMDFSLEELMLPEAASYHAVDFWQGRYQRLAWGGIQTMKIPAHGVRLLVLRPVGDQPAWVGDTLHISQGMAVQQWRVDSHGLEVELDLGRKAKGRVWMALPSAPRTIQLGDETLDWHEPHPGVYTFPAMFDGVGRLVLSWD